MGVGAVTVRASDQTDNIDQLTASMEEQANRLNGIFAFVLRSEDGSFVPKERDEVLVTDDGVRIWGGQIAALTPRFDGKAVVWTIRAVTFDSLLDHRVIETLVRSGNRTDQSDVQAIVAYHSGLEAATFVESTFNFVAGSDDAMDYSGMTQRKALDQLASRVGGRAYWVDENKKVHWTNPSSAQKVLNQDWQAGVSNWALDAAAVRTASAGPGGTGDYALVTTGSGVGMKETTQTITGLTGSRRYLFFADLYSSVAAKAQVRLDWLNASSVSQRVDVIDNTGLGTATWARKRTVVTAPASADRVVVRLGGVDGFTGTVRHDNMTLIGEDAAYGISTQPNGTTTFAPWSWSQPSESTLPINRVLVRGTGVSGWREHAASIAYYGQTFEGVLDDERVTTAAGIDSRADYVFRKYAFPRHSGTYQQERSGLRSGKYQLIEIPALGIQSMEWIATLRTSFADNGRLRFTVTYGQPQEDLAASMASVQSVFDAADVPVNSPPPPGVDTTAPATPTGLALATAQLAGPDGGLRPYLLATWDANGDADLGAYELQLDRAILAGVDFTVSASGTGGSLAPGTYRVRITGTGAEGGESATELIQEVALAAGERLYVNITALAGMASYNIYASVDDDPLSNGQTTTTTGSNVEITSAGAGAVAPSASTAVAFISPSTVRTSAVSHYTEDVRGFAYYAARLRALDHSGNASGWSSVVGLVAAKDTEAPAIPSGTVAVAGFKLVGLRWARNTEADLDRYEVRYTNDDGLGAPDATAWRAVIDTDATAIVIDGLAAEAAAEDLLYFQVRAVDRSNNVRTSEADPTAVDADDSPEAGWSNTVAYLTATPTLVGAADVAFNSVITAILAANYIDAGSIQAGTLSVGGLPDAPDFILVYNVDGLEIGRWDQNGLLIKDPSNTDRQVRFLNGALQFTEDGGASWTTALDASGITADAIKLGTAPGGHNNIPNSGFELTAFNALLTTVWTVTGEWATGTSQVYVNTAGSALTLTAVTY